MKTVTVLLASTLPPEPDTLTFANERGFTADHVNRELAHLNELKHLLLSFGGWAVVLRSEPDYDAIMSRGVLLDGGDAVLKPLDESQCHYNAAMQHLLNVSAHGLMTGYALSWDGMWRQHSWIYDKHADTIIETTTERVGYFGVLLTDLEALIFCTRNVPFSEDAKELVLKHPAFGDFLTSEEARQVD